MSDAIFCKAVGRKINRGDCYHSKKDPYCQSCKNLKEKIESSGHITSSPKDHREKKETTPDPKTPAQVSKNSKPSPIESKRNQTTTSGGAFPQGEPESMITEAEAFENPFSVVTENRRFLSNLERQGMNEPEIRKLLFEMFESKVEGDVYFFDLSDPETKQAREAFQENEKRISRAVAKIKTCINEKLISGEIKKNLNREIERLRSTKRDPATLKTILEKFPYCKARLVYKVIYKSKEKHKPKTDLQFLGLQISEMFKYIKKYSRLANNNLVLQRDYSNNDIFRLIAELVSKAPVLFVHEKLDWRRVKEIYYNAIRVK